MKIKLFLALSIIIAILFFIKQHNINPSPTEYMLMKNAKKKFKENRKKWINSMHKAAPGTDWQKMDFDYRSKMNKKKLELRKSLYNKGETDLKENFRSISGYWEEKGSNNLAGRMLTVDYDFQTDILYGASQGGNIWVGDMGGNWQNSINDYIQFNDIQMLRVIHIADTTRIIVAQSQPAILFYTDNNGATWEQYQGFNSSGNIIRAYVIDDTTMYVAKNSGGMIKIYKYSPQERQFNQLAIYTTSYKRFDMWTTSSINGIYVMNGNELNFIDENGDIAHIATLNLAFSNSSIDKTILTGAFTDQFHYIYALYRANGTAYLYKSEDQGIIWSYKNQISNDYLIPFTKNSFTCSQINPEYVYIGGMECFRSHNGGTSFTKVNNWWDYYNNPEEKLHADVPEIRTFLFEGIVEYVLISTDGGTFISSDNLNSVLNISLSGLRVSQYYSTYTNRNDLDYIFAGSQDQGLQVSTTGTQPLTDFTQIISGDYGHIVSGDGGNSFWAVYPGFVIFYPDYTSINNAYTWDFSGNNYLWMAPLMEDPTNPHKAYLGGGGFNGGSHLIHLSYFNNSLNATEEEYNFSGGSISAMGYSKVNPAIRYVLTSNGKFYWSTDSGENWQQTEQFFGPHAHYFYGSTIVSSNLNENTVYIGGSGYSNPAVYVSYDHGITFNALDDSLPHTLVFQLAITEDDSYLFAATEVGPFALELSGNSAWENIQGVSAPDQTYWSVDYIPQIRTARFGTYGRGIWDFVLQDNSHSPNDDIIEAKIEIKSYPNPFKTNTKLSIESNEKNIEGAILEIYNLKGRLVNRLRLEDNKTVWNGENKHGKKVSSGLYLCRLKSKGKTIAMKKIIKIK